MKQRILFALCAAFFPFAGFAQDMRIYTQIRVKSDEVSPASVPSSGDHQPLVRSLMIFHAGKVYDYIEPSQEITVYEPAIGRFTVLNKQKQLRGELTQDQIRHFLGLAKDEAQKRIHLQDSASTPKSLEILQFQLNPSFSVGFDPTKSQLAMESQNLKYVVNGFTPPNPDVVQSYLKVADWTVQLNSVLHPNSLLPGPRMALNQELRDRGILPATVELKVTSDPALHLVANHEWTWNLKETDRQMISEWERLLQDTSYRYMSFRQFQKEVLRTAVARRR